ncbi:MAG: hypothetical protein CL927_19315, partial [Deltaproteobacteria bacterium]|nr:hypothetical protein [Deltaproteobacteria bacterium]
MTPAIAEANRPMGHRGGDAGIWAHRLCAGASAVSGATWSVALGVALMGGLGALSRWGLGALVSRFVSGSFPAGTFLANALGCLVLGVVTGWSA